MRNCFFRPIVSRTATKFRQGLPALSPPDLSTGIVPVPGLAARTTYNNASYVRGYVQTWNFTVERRVKNWVTSTDSVGLRAVDPQNNLQMNWSPINGGSAGEILNRLTGRTASTLYIGMMGTSTYDSLQARAQGHFSGYQLNVAYTFGKALGSLGHAISPQVVIPQTTV